MRVALLVSWLSASAFALTLGASASETSAGQKVLRHKAQQGTITVCSSNGNHACYTAAVRPGRHGSEVVVLKRGTAIDCQGDCRETLRRATVDLWDTLRENGS